MHDNCRIWVELTVLVAGKFFLSLGVVLSFRSAILMSLYSSGASGRRSPTVDMLASWRTVG